MSNIAEMVEKMLNQNSIEDNVGHPVNPACSFMFGTLASSADQNEKLTQQTMQDIRRVYEKIDDTKKGLEEKMETNHKISQEAIKENQKSIKTVGKIMWGILILLLAATLALTGNFAQLAQKASMEAKLGDQHVTETTKTLSR